MEDRTQRRVRVSSRSNLDLEESVPRLCLTHRPMILQKKQFIDL